MKIDNLVWYSADREELPAIASGSGGLSGKRSLLDSSFLSGEMPAIVAIESDRGVSDAYSPPSLFVLRDESSSETLSWLRVFARDIFPLSQCARVVLETDLVVFDSRFSDGRSVRSDRWASIILGEALALGALDGEVGGVPLSRASACFSSAVARSEFLHENFDGTRLCIERLKSIEMDSRFVRRAVGVDVMRPIWAAVSATVGNADDYVEAVDLVTHVAETIAGDSEALGNRVFIHKYPLLRDDSIEARVVEFNRLMADVLARSHKSQNLSAIHSAILAAGAYLVGRGTGHSFLLKKASSISTIPYIWFGLIAALHGPKGWDASWSRVCKGMERHVRGAFRWGDPTTADLCWAEYSWLARTFSGNQAFDELSRNSSTALSIEVVPGATCQVRMMSEAGVGYEMGPPKRSIGAREPELVKLLEAYIGLAADSKDLLVALSAGADSGQASFQLESSSKSQPAKPKAKRSYKRPPNK